MKNETESQLEIRKLIDAMTYVRTWLMLYHQNAMQIAQEKGIWKYYLQPNDNAPEDTKVIACSVISADNLHFYDMNMQGYLSNAQEFLGALEKYLTVLDEVEEEEIIEAIETAIFFLNKQINSITNATFSAKNVFVDIEFTPVFEEKVSDAIQILEQQIEDYVSTIFGIEFIAPHEI